MSEDESYSTEQLRPIKTPHTNATLRAPEGMDTCRDLHCELVPDHDSKGVVTVSAWELDDKQREWIAAGAHIRMSVWQHPIPPLALAVEPPFCECGVETVYVRSEKRFACPGCGQRVDVGGVELSVIEGGADERSAEEQVRADFSPDPDGDHPSAA